MRVRNLLLLILLMQVMDSLAQEKNNLMLYEGNRQYKLKNYEEAQKYYEKAVDAGSTDQKTHFNLADTYYQQGKYKEAATKFEELVNTAETKTDKAKAYHNLGNSLLKQKDYQKSIDAYKNALKNNPSDDDTRYNLAYAQKKLDEQNKKNQNKDNKDDKKEDKKDDKKDDEKKDDNKDDKKDDKKNDKKDDKKDGDDKKNEENDKKEDAQPEKQQNGMDKKQAEQLLNAQNNREKEMQKKMQEKKMKQYTGGKPEKDW